MTYPSSKDIYNHSTKPSRKQNKMSLLDSSLLRACEDILAHVEEKCALRGRHVSLAKQREKRAQLYSFITGEGLRGILEGKDYYAVDMIFLSIASFTDKMLGLEGRCELSRLSGKYSETVTKVLGDEKDDSWVIGGLMMLRSEGKEF